MFFVHSMSIAKNDGILTRAKRNAVMRARQECDVLPLFEKIENFRQAARGGLTEIFRGGKKTGGKKIRRDV